MEIDTIVKTLKIICKNNEMLDTSSDMILDCAMRLHISHKISEERGNKSGTDFGATEKQKMTLKKFGIEYSEGITKKGASDLISKKIESLKDQYA